MRDYQVKARDYQLELLEGAVTNNTIVALGTGTGKTFVAILLIREYAARLENGEKAIFIANTIPLVEQQAAQIRKHCNLPVGLLHGGLSNKDVLTDRRKFEEFIQPIQVLVVTAEIFLNLLHQTFFDFDFAALLIFDECHHCLGIRHPYRRILEQYHRRIKSLQKNGHTIRILGLTASVLSKRIPISRIEMAIEEMEIAMNARLESASEITSFIRYGAKPKQVLIRCHDDMSCEDTIIDMLNLLLSFVEKSKDFDSEMEIDPRRPILEAISRTRNILITVGNYCAYKACILWQKRLKKLAEDQTLGVKQKNALNNAESSFHLSYKILSQKVNSINSYEKLLPTISDRMKRLIEVLASYKTREISCLIFVEQRFVAYMISVLLKSLAKWEAAYSFLKVDFLVGHAGTLTETDETKLANKKQEQTLQKFRNGALNVLVVTSVLEEGIDVRKCNLVIRFDPPVDFRSYIQSRGRARKENSAYIILSQEKDYSKLLESLTDYSQNEQFLLKRNKIWNPDDLDDNLSILTPEDNLIPRYEVKSTGAFVSTANAIQLIHRYCSKLPSDIFTHLQPHFTTYQSKVNGVDLFNAELVLPINSAVKETIPLEQPMPSKSLAKKAVALKGCEILHKRGELSDFLLPTGKETVANLLSDADVDDCEYLSIFSKMGTSKRRRLYDRKLSKWLSSMLPTFETKCDVYVIEVKLVKPISEESNPKRRRIINPFETDLAFGFLAKDTIPTIPAFPIFQRQGEMMVQIKKTGTQLYLTQELYDLIGLFHAHIFEDILRVAHSDFVFSPGNSPMPLLIIPLKRSQTLNSSSKNGIYELDMRYLNIGIRDPPKPPADEERRHFKYAEAAFSNSVVVPWYRLDEHNAYYYVADILPQNPSSPFPDEKFSSFNEYFLTKYKIEIFDQQQKLLDVDHTSARLNLLLPRTATRSLKRSLDPSQRQILVPELVHLHSLPMDLWIMIPALPTIIYRLNTFLLAEELRIKVVTEAFKRDPTIPEGFQWEPLSYQSVDDSSDQSKIKNLSHLKQASKLSNYQNSSNKENVKKHRNIENDMTVTGKFDGMTDYEIGVWNPADGAKFLTQSNDKESTVVKDDEISEMLVMGNNNTVYGYHSDDEDDVNHYNIFFDFQHVLNNEIMDMETALPDRKPLGWNDDLSPNIISIESNNLPLAMKCANPDINIPALMKDLEFNFTQPDKAVLDGTQQRKGAKYTKPMLLDPMQAMDEEEKLRGKPRDEDLLEDAIDWNELQLRKFSLTERTEYVDNEEDENRRQSVCLNNVPIAEPNTYTLLSPKLISMTFSFEDEYEEKNLYGVSPTLLIQALTTSTAGDGINLERLETIGDSFLKLAVTNYLYCEHSDQHEGKLSFARSKEVSNCHLYTLGRKRNFPYLMEATKFDPLISWLPPSYASTTEFHAFNPFDEMTDVSMEDCFKETEATGWGEANDTTKCTIKDGIEQVTFTTAKSENAIDLPPLPYNMVTQQYISDKSIADCVEALIGAHLIYLGPGPTQKFMGWLGLKVLQEKPKELCDPLLRFVDSKEEPNKSKFLVLDLYKKFNFEAVEKSVGYIFANKAYLVQAFTHASYYKNRVTGCYQRLEFLGDAVLDYLITRFLFEHKKLYSPGVLTDLRSALVNNTIFASLAIKFNLHKHFLNLCPSLHAMIDKFVNLCETKSFGHLANFDDEMFMVTEDDIDEGHEEDVEVPKALGDIFESLAGAIYLDCGMNLDVVWRVIYGLMRECIEKCCQNPPQAPVRELFERKNCRARFTKLERILETGKVRVTVDVNDNMRFTGMGRSYRIAKCTAAKRALQHLKKLDQMSSKNDLKKE